MASLTELTQWEVSIYQIETTDPVIGGDDGLSNRQGKLLANRTAYLRQQVELKAPLASPIFTGTPAVPTAAADTSTTQAASTAFVVGQAATIAPVVDGVAAIGTSKKFARQDHVHPTDTTRAPIASPTFTGVPAAPTAAAGTNTTQIANTAFVATAIANLIVSSPAALDTLNELAAAIGDDPNFAVTMTNMLADKVSISNLQKGIHSFSIDSGVANTYVVNLTPALASRSEGQVIWFKVSNSNTGTSTINDGISVVPLVGGAHSALQGGEMAAGGVAAVQWNSTVGTGSYVLLFCTGRPFSNTTVVASIAITTGAAIDITGIPSWAKKIKVVYDGVSTNGTSPLLIQVGSGSILTSGYTSSMGWTGSSTPVFSAAGLVTTSNLLATSTVDGVIDIAKTSDGYVSSGLSGGTGVASSPSISVGSITTPATIDRVRITTVNGTDTFDAGKLTIIVEG